MSFKEQTLLQTAVSTEGSVKQNEFVLQQFFLFCFAFEISRNMTFQLGPDPGNQLQMGVVPEKGLQSLRPHSNKSAGPQAGITVLPFF